MAVSLSRLETLRVEYASKVAAQAKADADALLGAAKAMGELGTATNTTDQVLKRTSQTYDAIGRKVDGVAAATDRLDRAEASHASRVNVVIDAYKRGEVTLAKAQQDIARLNTTFEQTTKKIIDYGQAVEARFTQAGTAVSTSLTTAGASTAKFTTQTNQASHAVRQLGIQSIDVFQQLASGAPIMTTFIQQGGQIGQVMAVSNTSIGAVAKSIGGMIAANAGIIAATAGMVGFGVAIYAVASRSSELESQQRALGVAIAGVGRSAELSTGQLQGYITQLKQQGVAAADAQAAVTALARNPSLSSGAIGRIVGLGADAAAGSGKSVQEVISLMSDAMKGSVDGIQKLDEAFNLLTATEAASIRNMVEHGDKAAALDQVFRKLSDRVSGLNAEALSPMEQAFRDLGNGWDDFMNRIARSGPVLAMMRGAANLLRDANVSDLTGQLAQLQGEAAQQQGFIDRYGNGGSVARQEQAARARERLAEIQSQMGGLQGRIDSMVMPRVSPTDSLSIPDAASSKSLASLAATRAGASDAGKLASLTAETDKFRAALKSLDPAVEGNKALINDYTRAIAANEKSIADLNKKDEVHRTGLEKTGDTYDSQIAAAQRLTAAYGVNRAEVVRITAVREAEAKAISNGLTPGTKAYAAEVGRLTDRIMTLRREEGQNKLAEQIRDTDEATEAQLRINAAYDGTAGSLDRVQAQEKAHAAALRQNLEPGMKEYDATVGRLTESYIRAGQAADDFKHIQSSVQAVTDILSTAFDRLGQGIVDAFLTGKGAAVSFSSIVRSVMGSVATSIAQLGVVNPILNSFGGTQRNSLWTGLGTLTSNAGVSASATGGLNIMNAASNASTFGGITDALGLTDFAGKISGIGEYLGLTGSNGIVGNIGSGISSLLSTGINGVSLGTATNTALAGMGAGVYGPAAPSSVLAAQGGATIGGVLSGVGLGFGAGSLAGGFLQSSLGKVGPAPTIGAGLGAAGGAALGSIIPGIGTVLGGLLGGLLGGGGGGLIGPKKATPFSATGLNATDGMLSVGQTFSQIVDVSQEVADLQQQTAQINSILAASNLRIANGVSADNFGQQRIIGGNSGTWLNFGQGDGRPRSIADAFGELRFSSADATLNRALQGKAFGNLEELQATVARITTFVNDTAPALIALGKTETTYGLGSLEGTIAVLSRRFDDALDRARELGHAEHELTTARATSIATAWKSVNEVMDQSKMGFDLRYWQAKATNDNDPRLAFDASLVAFDVRAGQERAAFEAQLLGILGDAGKTSALYLDQMAQLDRVLYEERLTLLTQFNSQALQSDQSSLAARARGEQSALATITSIADYAASLPFSDKSPMTGRAQYSLALGNFQSIAAGIGEGDFNALSQLPAAADQLLGSSRNLFGSGQQYATDFASVQAVLRGAVSQSPEDIVAAAIRASEAQQTAVLGGLIEKMVEKLDAILAETRLQAMRPAA